MQSGQNNVVSKLELDSAQLSKWFDDNVMKINAESCHFLIFGSKTRNVPVQIGATPSERF